MQTREKRASREYEHCSSSSGLCTSDHHLVGRVVLQLQVPPAGLVVGLDHLDLLAGTVGDDRWWAEYWPPGTNMVGAWVDVGHRHDRCLGRVVLHRLQRNLDIVRPVAHYAL